MRRLATTVALLALVLLGALPSASAAVDSPAEGRLAVVGPANGVLLVAVDRLDRPAPAGRDAKAVAGPALPRPGSRGVSVVTGDERQSGPRELAGPSRCPRGPPDSPC